MAKYGLLRNVYQSFIDSLRRLRTVQVQYGKELLAFRTKTNLFRFQTFSVIGIIISIIAVIYVKPEIAAIRKLFFLLAGFLILMFGLSGWSRAKIEEQISKLHTGIVDAGVFFLVAWATLQLIWGEGEVAGYVSYVGLMIAVAAVFYLRPIVFFSFCVISLAAVILLPSYAGLSEISHLEKHFAFLANSLLFAWVVSILHYFAAVEIFYAKKKIDEEGNKAELALQGGNLGYWNWNIEGESIEVDGRWLGMLGYEAQEKTIAFDEFFRMLVPEDRGKVAERVQSYFSGEMPKYTATFRMEARGGGEKWIYAEGRITEWSSSGEPLFMHGIHQDVQEIHEKQRKLQESERRFRAYTENAPVGVFIVGGLRFTYVNPEAISMTGYSEEELTNSINLYTLIHPEEREKLKMDVKELFERRETKPNYTYRIVSKKGDIRWFETRISTIDWRKRTFLLSAVDITERRKAEEKLKEYATYDELTGIFNRRVGLTLLGKEMDRVHRYGYRFTLCFIDVNGLKPVNDEYGHEEGDELILTVVRMVEESMRGGDVLCRIGGDEFLLLFRDCDMGSAELVRERMEESFRRINESGKKSYEISVSYGLIEYDKESEYSVQELLHRADSRMYEDKMKRKSVR